MSSSCHALRPVFVGAALMAMLVGAGCSTKHYRTSADKEVYDLLRRARRAALGAEDDFSIERESFDPLAGLPHKDQPLIPDPTAFPDLDAMIPSDPPAIISLASGLEIAVRNSREYQDRKEDVYLQVLGLTLERHNWSFQFSALLSGGWQKAGEQESWAGDADFGITKMLETGGRITLGLSTQVVQFMVGDRDHDAMSRMTLAFVQPLWRGAGKRVAQENLRQAERDVIYSIRSFARFHKTFTVRTASSYYSVLRQRDTVLNEWNNYQRLVLATERVANLAKAGRVPELQVDQARQDELRARDRFVRSVQEYRRSLDQFKIDLGLRTDANVDVDTAELERLAATGLIHPTLDADAAVNQALTLRLDLLSAEDRIADAGRKVEVAANGLGPDVDLVASAGIGTEGTSRPVAFRFEEGSYSAGIEADLPLDRKAERNTYRRALINLERARRDGVDLTDTIRLQVRQAWRKLQEAKESHEIQRVSVELAQRRVESTTLLQQAGRASTRDILEAQAALLEAQNGLTRALVDHTLARLELWRDIGTLVLTPDYELKEETLGTKVE